MRQMESAYHRWLRINYDGIKYDMNRFQLILFDCKILTRESQSTSPLVTIAEIYNMIEKDRKRFISKLVIGLERIFPGF